MDKPYNDILHAIKALAGQCDGACAHDGGGFDRLDAEFGHSLAKRQQLTYKQAAAGHRMLRKYRAQLRGLGIQYEDIMTPNPAAAPPPSRPSSMMEAEVSGQTVTIRFSFPKGDDKFAEVLDVVKQFPGRRFDGQRKCWEAPVNEYTLGKLRELGFKITGDLPDEKPINIQLPDGLTLYPFQVDGVAGIEKFGGRVIIGDEMGLGKTVQALAWLRLHPEARPAVVIVPAVVKLNWYKETKKWIPDSNPVVVYGQNNVHAYNDADIIIINYDIIKHHIDAIIERGPQVMIIDECHYIKNKSAQRTKAVRHLGKYVDNIIALSGTPITNNPVDFFTTLSLLRQDLFPSFFQYAQRYTNAKHNGFGWVFTGAANSNELHEKLVNTLMVRRLKKDVLKDLPEKQRTLLPFELTNRKEYNAAEDDLIGWIAANQGEGVAARAAQAESLVRFGYLKQLAAEGKKEAALQWIQDFIDSGEKLVVFAVHHKMIDSVVERFGAQCVKIDGRDNAQVRDEAVTAFQNDPNIKLFVGNIKAAGVGITLTATSSVAFLELDWVPGNHDQAEDRVHRIGQEADSVNAYYLLAADTIEEEIAMIIDAKRQALTAVLDGKDVEESALLTELFNAYKRRAA